MKYLSHIIVPNIVWMIFLIGLKKERIRQIQIVALGKLRKTMEDRSLTYDDCFQQ